jgi:DNA-binding transcriptional LysR family regulator
VDALAPDAAPLDLIRAFYETSDAEVDIAVSRGNVSWETALADGSLDAAFARVRGPLPPGIRRVPAWLEPMYVLVGRQHAFARRKRVPAAELSGRTAWMPNNARDSEWAEYYRFLSADLGVTIDTSGPVFGREHIVERISDSPELMMFVARAQFSGHSGVVHVPVTDPAPAYPWSLMWHEANRHPALAPLIAHVTARYEPCDGNRQWLPAADRPLFPAG